MRPTAETPPPLEIAAELKKRVIGQREVIEHLLITLFARGHGLFVGVPAIIGANGVEKIIEVELTEEERVALEASAGAVKELIDKLPVGKSVAVLVQRRGGPIFLAMKVPESD